MGNWIIQAAACFREGEDFQNHADDPLIRTLGGTSGVLELVELIVCVSPASCSVMVY